MRPPRSCMPRPCTRLHTRLASVALALFANAFALANPFPYAPFMVMTYGLTAKRDEVGFFAGFVLSAFMVGRLLSSYPLGLLSDAVGRRPGPSRSRRRPRRRAAGGRGRRGGARRPSS